MLFSETVYAFTDMVPLIDICAGESDTELQAMAKKDMDSTQQHIQHLEEKVGQLVMVSWHCTSNLPRLTWTPDRNRHSSQER